MSSERISQAMSRIDAALARIETQAALTGRATPSATSHAPAQLIEQHEALRDRVDSALAELDALIEGLEK